MKLSASEKRLVVQKWKQANPKLTSVNIVNMFEDDYEGTISRSFVRKWWLVQRHQRMPGSGGHNKVPDDRKEAAVVACAGFKHNRDGSIRRRMSPRKAAVFFRKAGTPISRTSIQNALKGANLRYIQRSSASRLSTRNLVAREQLDEDEGMRDEEEWMPVWFTDSTPVHLQWGGNNRNSGSYLPPGERAPPRTKNKHSRYLHVYGAVCGWKLLGPYYIDEGVSITADVYIEQVLRPMLRDMQKFAGEKGEEIVFELQQDGAGAHFARKTVDFLTGEGINFWPKGKWPGNSPDLSPIENIWGILKESIYEEGEPRTIIGLKRKVGKFFSSFSEQMCQKVAHSMPKRFILLRSNNFYGISY